MLKNRHQSTSFHYITAPQDVLHFVSRTNASTCQALIYKDKDNH